MHSYIRPHEYVAIRLPSDATRIVEVVPNTTVSLGKYGTFPTNQIIGRPFYLTFEIQDPVGGKGNIELRVVSAAELHAEALISEGSGEADGEGEELEMTKDAAPMRTNRDIIDEASTQKLTLEEIEALKKESTGAGKEIISRLLESHSALDQKTAFSLAKYTLRKRKKYMKRFTVFPLDVHVLTNYMLEKDAPRVMELRNEVVGMVGCFANVHHGGNVSLQEALASKPNGRYLVVDETGGLIVAAMAERMGILYPHHDDDEENRGDAETEQQAHSGPLNSETNENMEVDSKEQDASKPRHLRRPAMSASGNTITLLHAHAQPNLSLLRYFGYDADSPDESHPLYTHLKAVSWLQLLDPNADSIYANKPEVIPDSTLFTWKPSKRSMYFRKQNRWARVRSVVDEARAGGFDGLVVATLMEPASVMRHTVPLLSGSAPAVVYSPSVEPLVELIDLYSTARKTAYISRRQELQSQKQLQQPSTPQPQPGEQKQGQEQSEDTNENGKRDASDSPGPDLDLPELDAEFPVNPTLLLAPTLHTSRVRPWQVLPGRTHPLMSGRGGAEGYVFHAIRVLPTREYIQAAGHPCRKRRKVKSEEQTT